MENRNWWNEKKEEAAELVSEGERSLEQIARQLAITSRCLRKWRNRPEFAERVDGLVAAAREKMRVRAIAQRETRIAEIDSRWAGLRSIVAARGQRYAGIPGAESGLMVRKGKRIPSKPAADIEEFDLDVALLREMRELEKHAARELNQYGQPVEDDEPGVLIREYVGVDIDQL